MRERERLGGQRGKMVENILNNLHSKLAKQNFAKNVDRIHGRRERERERERDAESDVSN